MDKTCKIFETQLFYQSPLQFLQYATLTTKIVLKKKTAKDFKEYKKDFPFLNWNLLIILLSICYMYYIVQYAISKLPIF